jgi:electron transfer flavoprotein beta subunit
MRILVSFKVTPDYEALRPTDWAAAETGGVETRYVRRILGCFDESALELALRLTDTLAARGETASLGALAVGGREAEPYLKTVLALGYQRAARVDPAAALDFAPGVTATLIAAYVTQVDRGDVLVLGCQSGPADSGTVPFLVAERLGWPCLTQVTEVEPADRGRLRVAWMTADGLLRATVRPPCMLAVGNAVVSRLRVPTLTDRLAHKDAHIEALRAADLGVDVDQELHRETCAAVGLERIDRSRAGVIIEGDTPREKARALYSSHLQAIIGDL